MRRVTLRDRLSYMFDGLMSRGTWVMLIGLAILTAAIVFIAALLARITGTAPEGMGFGTILWKSFMSTLDTSAMGDDTSSPAFVFLLMWVTVGGVFILGALIGIITTGMEGRLERLRQGRSLVLEQDHTVVLGWNPQVFTIIAELVTANENRKSGASVVILADRDKVEMEQAVRSRVPDCRNTRIVCRSGSPLDPADLAIVNLGQSRSIIILSEGDNPDMHVIKSLLAVVNAPDRRETPYTIVAQIADPSNLEVVRMVGARDRVAPILTTAVVARVVAQTSRQVGLSVVYTELLDFGGDEIYFDPRSELEGVTFGEVLTAYDSCTVIGIFSPEDSVSLNPPMSRRIGPGESVIVIAEDDAGIELSGSGSAGGSPAPTLDRRDSAAGPPESTLVLGWNCAASTVVRELDSYVSPGSRVHVVADPGEAACGMDELATDLKNLQLTFSPGDICNRALLESVGADDFDHIIVLAYSNLSPMEADAITLVTLLHLRDIAERDATPFSIVSEMLDVRNRELAKTARVDDFIISDHLISLMMAQFSENIALDKVFEDLFDDAGSEVYLKPITDYIEPGASTTVLDLVESARARSEVFIGYRVASECSDVSKGYGVHLNLPKSHRIVPAAEDRVIVLSES